MKTVFDLKTREELIDRIRMLNENSKAEWGKMNVYQMIKHCTLWEEMMWGRKMFKRSFAAYLFGKIALKSVLKDETALRRNTPTVPALLTNEKSGDLATEKMKWISSIHGYGEFSNASMIHPFFGRMTRQQIGYFVYKHTDHHLRQFNC